MMQAMNIQRILMEDSNPIIRRILVRLIAVAAFALLVLAAPGDWQRSEPALAASGGPEMKIEIIAGSGGFCNGNNCYAEAGSTFTLGIDVVTAPAADYIAIQTYIFFGNYDPTASEDDAGPNTCSDGIDNEGLGGNDRTDPDCTNVDLVYQPRLDVEDEFLNAQLSLIFRDYVFPGLVVHIGLTAAFPPLLPSSFVGPHLELDMSCPAAPVTATIDLVPFGDPFARTHGSLFVEPDLVTPVIPKVNSITVNCVSPQPFPGDTDGDGCADAREMGTDVTLGGLRDWLDPWDFYDVGGLAGPVPDGEISLLFDVLEVINHYAPTGDPPYDAHYDRGPSAGPNVWNMTEPDGVIDQLNDINGVIAQYSHNCT